MKNYQYLIFILLFIFSCYKDKDIVVKEKETVIELTEVLVDTKIAGYVLDSDGERLSNYSLIINDETFNVNSNYFLIELNNAKQKRQTIFIEKEGIEIGIVTVMLYENDINRFELNTFTTTINHEIFNSTIQLDQIKLDISDAQFENLEGNPHVAFASTTQKTSNIGFSKLGKSLLIQPIYSFKLDFLDDANQAIVLKDTSVSLQFTGLNAPTNTLFHFNRSKEIWEEIPTLTNDNSIKIKESGYYLLGTKDVGIFVKGSLTKQQFPLSYYPLKWSNTPNNGHFFTTSKGNWITILPTHQDINLFLDDECNHDTNIHRFSTSDTDLKSQDLTIATGQMELLNTEVVNCDGEIQNKSNVLINNQEIYSFENTSISSWLPSPCNAENEFSAVDLEGNQGIKLPWNNPEILFNCNEIPKNYSFIKIAEDIKVMGSFIYKNNNGKTVLTDKNGKFKITLLGTKIGEYQEDRVYISINDATFGNNGYYIHCEGTGIGCGIDNCKISPKISDNGWITLRFSGSLWMRTIDPPVADNFDIEAEITAKIE